MRALACLAAFGLIMGAGLVLAQEQPRPERQKAPQGQPGQPTGQQQRQGGVMSPEVREKYQQLGTLDQKLGQAERDAMDNNSELWNLRKYIQETLEDVAKKAQELEEKLGDAAAKSSAESAQAVKDRRALLGELENQWGPQNKGRFWLMRVNRHLAGGPGAGQRPQGGAQPQPGGAQAPRPQQPK